MGYILCQYCYHGNWEWLTVFDIEVFLGFEVSGMKFKDPHTEPDRQLELLLTRFQKPGDFIRGHPPPVCLFVFQGANRAAEDAERERRDREERLRHSRNPAARGMPSASSRPRGTQDVAPPAPLTPTSHTGDYDCSADWINEPRDLFGESWGRTCAPEGWVGGSHRYRYLIF